MLPKCHNDKISMPSAKFALTFFYYDTRNIIKSWRYSERGTISKLAGFPYLWVAKVRRQALLQLLDSPNQGPRALGSKATALDAILSYTL